MKATCKSCGAEFLAKPGQRFCISCRIVSFHLTIAQRSRLPQADNKPTVLIQKTKNNGSKELHTSTESSGLQQ